MDISYINLFAKLAQSSEVIAEKVIELDNEKNDIDGAKTATIMRDDYAKLYDKLHDNSNVKLTYNDFAKLLVSAFIVSNNLEDQIKNYQKSVDSYKLNLIPKLQRIIDETKESGNAMELANELFVVNSEN